VKRTLVVCLLSFAAACDPLATGNYKPAYVTINGFVDGSTALEMPPKVHIALLWQNDQTPGSNYGQQFVDVLTQFPAKFSVDVNLAPKSQVVDTLQSNTAIALGVDPAVQGDYEIVEGRAPRSANELVTSADFLRATGARPGDTL